MDEAEIKIGQIIEVAGEKFIVLDKQKHSVLCLAGDFVYKNTKFDNNTNNYAESDIRRKLNTEYLPKIADSVGRINIWDAEVDLTSDDGLDDYGRVTDPVGLLTADMYRKYLSWESACLASRRSPVRSRPSPPLTAKEVDLDE